MLTAHPAAMAKNAALVAGAYALIGVILSFWLPQPKEEDLEH